MHYGSFQEAYGLPTQHYTVPHLLFIENFAEKASLGGSPAFQYTSSGLTQ
jgi:hypothetical protein